jgi:hypothetical protein
MVNADIVKPVNFTAATFTPRPSARSSSSRIAINCKPKRERRTAAERMTMKMTRPRAT